MHANKTTLAKPKLRGVSHLIAAFFAFAAVVVLVTMSASAASAWASVIYGFTLVSMFVISAVYHKPNWSPKVRQRLRQLDHVAIYLLIAGTTTPICLLALESSAGKTLLAIMWLGAFVGTLRELLWKNAPKALSALIYVVLAWLGAPFLADIYRGIGTSGLALLLTGAVIYTLGALIYAFKWPNPAPKVFGYHEIFHLFVIVASAFHFVVIWNLVRTH